MQVYIGEFFIKRYGHQRKFQKLSCYYYRSYGKNDISFWYIMKEYIKQNDIGTLQ